MDVAAQFWISLRTVAFHLRNIFTKTGVTHPDASWVDSTLAEPWPTERVGRVGVA